MSISPKTPRSSPNTAEWEYQHCSRAHHDRDRLRSDCLDGQSRNVCSYNGTSDHVNGSQKALANKSSSQKCPNNVAGYTDCHDCDHHDHDELINDNNHDRSHTHGRNHYEYHSDIPDNDILMVRNSHTKDHPPRDSESSMANTIHMEEVIHKLSAIGTKDATVDVDKGYPAQQNTSQSHSSISRVNCTSSICAMQDFSYVVKVDDNGIHYERYKSEHQMMDIMKLISKDLSEPYSIYTYRYFIHNWPHLCFLAKDGDVYVGAIVCKLEIHKRSLRSRGYIAMLAVDETYRRKKIGSQLVSIAIEAMISRHCDEVVLEAECTNKSALRLYEQLGFVRDKRLYRYYLNGVDAFRLKLWIT